VAFIIALTGRQEQRWRCMRRAILKRTKPDRLPTAIARRCFSSAAQRLDTYTRFLLGNAIQPAEGKKTYFKKQETN